MCRVSFILPLLCASIACGPKALEKKSDAELEQMLSVSNPEVQAQGAYGLARHGAKARHAVPTLIKSLSSPNVLVRQQACSALGNIGPEASEAANALVETLHDSEWAVRRQAAQALGQIEAPLEVAEGPLQQCEANVQENSLVRKAAREALSKLRSGKSAGDR